SESVRKPGGIAPFRTVPRRSAEPPNTARSRAVMTDRRRGARMLSPFRRFSAQPAPSGLYDGVHEHDACGVAFVATMRGEPGHDIVDLALTALRNLEHRGAVGSEPDTGDGAGILTQLPDAFLRAVVD